MKNDEIWWWWWMNVVGRWLASEACFLKGGLWLILWANTLEQHTPYSFNYSQPNLHNHCKKTNGTKINLSKNLYIFSTSLKHCVVLWKVADLCFSNRKLSRCPRPFIYSQSTQLLKLYVENYWTKHLPDAPPPYSHPTENTSHSHLIPIRKNSLWKWNEKWR